MKRAVDILGRSRSGEGNGEVGEGGDKFGGARGIDTGSMGTRQRPTYLHREGHKTYSGNYGGESGMGTGIHKEYIGDEETSSRLVINTQSDQQPKIIANTLAA